MYRKGNGVGGPERDPPDDDEHARHEAQRAFVREADLGAGFYHPAILRVLYFVMSEGRWLLVTTRGRADLGQILKSQRKEERPS